MGWAFWLTSIGMGLIIIFIFVLIMVFQMKMRGVPFRWEKDYEERTKQYLEENGPKQLTRKRILLNFMLLLVKFYVVFYTIKWLFY